MSWIKNKKQIKTENMQELEKIAELEKQLAELKKIVQDKQKEITGYPSVLAKIGHDDRNDVVKIDGFTTAQTEVVLATIQKIRICEAMNDGWLPKRNEERHYPYYKVSSGFDFGDTNCDGTDAGTGSASRLSFKDAKTTREYDRLFGQTVERKIIGF